MSEIIKVCKFNPAQEIFLVLFSILYGVMLQSLPGGLFPLGKLLLGHVSREETRSIRQYENWGIHDNREYMWFWGRTTFISLIP